MSKKKPRKPRGLTAPRRGPQDQSDLGAFNRDRGVQRDFTPAYAQVLAELERQQKERAGAYPWEGTSTTVVETDPIVIERASRRAARFFAERGSTWALPNRTREQFTVFTTGYVAPEMEPETAAAPDASAPLQRGGQLAELRVEAKAVVTDPEPKNAIEPESKVTEESPEPEAPIAITPPAPPSTSTSLRLLSALDSALPPRVAREDLGDQMQRIHELAAKGATRGKLLRTAIWACLCIAANGVIEFFASKRPGRRRGAD